MVSASPAHARINSFEHAGFLHILAREVTPVYNWIYATFSPKFSIHSTLLLLDPTWSGCSACVCKWC